MKKILILLTLILAFACANSGSKSGNSSTKEGKNLVSYTFKVDGLQDSALSDTIWKMIFQFDGIDKLIISKKDSTVSFSVDPAKLNAKKLMTEIEKRGGKVIQE